MNLRKKSRIRHNQINILHTSTRKRHSQKIMMKWTVIIALCMLSLVTTGIGAHYFIKAMMKQAFYDNPHYALKEIVIDVKSNIPKRQIQQMARLSLGQNVMALDLEKIQRDVERLPYVAEAQVERQLPGRIIIRITERLPIVKVVGTTVGLGTREVYYLDREGILLKPRVGEVLRDLPEITGIRFMDLEAGQRVEQPEVLKAINLLKMMELTKLRADLDVKTIDLSMVHTLRLYTSQGTQIRFRLEYFEQQLTRLMEILDFCHSRQRLVASVDLTPERNVPVTFIN